MFITTMGLSQRGSVSGNVQMNDGTDATGALIILLDTKFNAVAEEDGKYEIKNVPPATYTIQVSYLGAVTTEKQITLSKGQDLNLNFQLEEDQKNLQEVVVKAQSMARSQETQAMQIESVELKTVTTRVRDLT
ncbi:MAG: carboxypeptidase-like regulatory domain-containing protein, partial [Bacteroidota bacterium]